MKNSFLFIFLVGLFLTACSEKDSLDSQLGKDLKVTSRTDANFGSISSKTEAYKAMAYAISILYYEDIQLNNCIHDKVVVEAIPYQFDEYGRIERGTEGEKISDGNQMISPDYKGPLRMKDILIRDLVCDPDIKVRINEILWQIEPFTNDPDPIKTIFDIDPIISINMPSDIVRSCDMAFINNSEPEDIIPFVVADYALQKEFLFINGEIIERDFDEYSTCGFYIAPGCYVDFVLPLNN